MFCTVVARRFEQTGGGYPAWEFPGSYKAGMLQKTSQ